jgi:iron complex outermembrane receptor protein
MTSRGSVNLGGFFDQLEARVAYGDYTHAEIEDGVAGTRFFNRAIESRLVLKQARHGGWRGESGVQYSTRNFRIIGEPLLPNSVTERVAGFTRQQLSLGNFDLEGSLRGEHVSVKPKGLGAADAGRSFDLFAAGAGVAWHPVGAGHAEPFGHPRRARADGGRTLHRRPPRRDAVVRARQSGIPARTQQHCRGRPAISWRPLCRCLHGLCHRFQQLHRTDPDRRADRGAPVYQYIQLPAKFRGLEAEGSWKALDWHDGRSLSVEGRLTMSTPR